MTLHAALGAPTVRRRNNHTVGGATFVGPLDALPAPTAAYSMRRLLSAYVANKAIQVRRASDNGTLDVGFLANGNLDVPSLTTFLAATSGFITTWYDQSGNSVDVIQATAGNQPALAFPGNFNSVPSPVFATGIANSLQKTASTNPVLTGNSTIVHCVRESATGGQVCAKTSANTYQEQNDANSKTLVAIPGVAAASVPATTGKTPAVNYIEAVTRGGGVSPWAISYYLNGAANGTATLTGNGGPGTTFTVGQSIGMEIPELLIWDSILSGANLTTLFANMNAYYAVF